jgi:hypothetical protein
MKMRRFWSGWSTKMAWSTVEEEYAPWMAGSLHAKEEKQATQVLEEETLAGTTAPEVWRSISSRH